MKTELEIGQELQGGIYVGTLDNHAIIMAPKETIKKLNWYDSIEYCNNLEMNGFSDWYLPNKEELNLIYKSNLIIRGWFWSSVEVSSASSWSQYLSYGDQFQNSKDGSSYCAAVRKVSLNTSNKPRVEEIISYRYKNKIYETKKEASLIQKLDELIQEYGKDMILRNL